MKYVALFAVVYSLLVLGCGNAPQETTASGEEVGGRAVTATPPDTDEVMSVH